MWYRAEYQSGTLAGHPTRFSPADLTRHDDDAVELSRVGVSTESRADEAPRLRTSESTGEPRATLEKELVGFPFAAGSCGSVAATDLFRPTEALCKSEPPVSHKTNQKPNYFFISSSESKLWQCRLTK